MLLVLVLDVVTLFFFAKVVDRNYVIVLWVPQNNLVVMHVIHVDQVIASCRLVKGCLFSFCAVNLIVN